MCEGGACPSEELSAADAPTPAARTVARARDPPDLVLSQPTFCYCQLPRAGTSRDCAIRVTQLDGAELQLLERRSDLGPIAHGHHHQLFGHQVGFGCAL